MGMTMAEKVLARASGKGKVSPGEFVTAKVDALMEHDRKFYAACEAIMERGFTRVWDPTKIVVIIDHAVPAPDIMYAEKHRKAREYAKTLGITHFYDTGVGICHQVFVEKGHALPGSLITGGDSHTTTYGAMGAASCGIGLSEEAYVLAKGSLWFMVPETIRFIIRGTLSTGVTAKDILLALAGRYSTEVAQYKAVEFSGPGAKNLTISDRLTITNMGVEIGAKFAFFEADHRTLEYLKDRTAERAAPFGPDPDARYLAEYEVDISSMEPQIACPHDVGNVKPVSEIGDVPVQQAFIGSCTNGRFEDLESAAHILKGKRVHPGTRLLVIPASREIYLRAAEAGLIQIFLEAGAMMGTTGCGPCGGMHMGILATGETAISSTNRNFKARMGSLESFVYLASAETVAASAIEGKIADPRKYIK